MANNATMVKMSQEISVSILFFQLINMSATGYTMTDIG